MSPHIFLVALASAIPTINVEKLCHGQATLQNDKADHDRCVQGEQGALERLRSKWTQYPAKERDECARVIAEAPGASYVELETCIEVGISAAAHK